MPTEHSKTFALLTACSLSIGTHFGSYLLGPLKSRLHDHLHTTGVQFSLMTGALSLPSTITPLVAGLVIGRIGVVRSAMIATATSLIGQVILLVGDIFESVPLMAIGLFVFGIAISPLAVCQESLIFHLFPKSGHVNVLLSLGLLLGKLSSFLASLFAVPLSNVFGEHAPFTVSVGLSLLSFGCSTALAMGQSKAGDQRGGKGELEARVVKKKGFTFDALASLGPVFWWYIVMNILSGAIWQPFLHLSSNIIQHRYGLSDGMAAAQSSLLLSGAIILYPLVGSAVDRYKTAMPSIPFALFVLSSGLTMACYAWLNLPPDRLSALPGMVLFAAGSGMSTLLMVVLVPFIVPSESISAGLGLHKAMEMTSSTLTLVLAGLELDWKKAIALPPKPSRITVRKHVDGDDIRPAEVLLRIFLTLNALQFGAAWKLYSMQKQHPKPEDNQRDPQVGYERLPMNELSEGDEFDTSSLRRGDHGTLQDDDNEGDPSGIKLALIEQADESQGRNREARRGIGLGLGLSLGYVAVVWVVFWASAVMKLTVNEQ